MRTRTISIPLTAAILTFALVVFEPLVFGQAGNSGGDSVTKELSLDLGKGVSMKLVRIPAGKFKMGNHDTPAETVKKVGGWMSWPGHPHHGRTDQRQIDEGHLVDEYPAHEVTISKPFYMGIYEVTQAQWKAVMGTEPWMTKQALGFARMQPRPQGFDDYPVVWVSSYDAIEFCRKLSKKTGRTVFLPTEAQWEYACRAGSSTAFSFGDELSKLNDHGWYGGRRRDPKGDYAHRVGQKKPNAWGLYDMHGNVWEFCRDWYDKDFYSRSSSVDPENTTETDKRSLRSGSFHSVPTVSRSAQRNSWTSPKTVRYNYGLRVVVAADTKEKKQQVEPQFRHLYRTIGEKSSTKIKLVSGPEAIKMRNGRVPGKRWFATSGQFKFKLTIQDGVDLKVEKLIERLQELPLPYVRAYEVVSDEKEDGVAVYKSLGGASAHGGKQYINIIPGAGPMILAHEVGHTLEQKTKESDPEILDKWEAAIEADKVSISNYGDKVRHEDLGEFSKVYAACLDAGESQLSKLRKLSPARFKLWESILNDVDLSAKDAEVLPRTKN